MWNINCLARIEASKHNKEQPILLFMLFFIECLSLTMEVEFNLD